jgi:DNA-binding beta-propeller fold protein YncE
MDKKRSTQIWVVICCLAAMAGRGVPAEQDSQPAPVRMARLRHPVAAVFLADGNTLCVANRRAGSVALVDLSAGRVRDEWIVGERLASLAALPDRRHLLAVDEQRHELIALFVDGSRLTVRARLPVGSYPVSVAVQADGMRATVACLWSRRLDVVDLTPLLSSAGPVTLHILHTLRLPFAPRMQCVLPRYPYVAVADAFGGHLAVVDVASGRLITVRELPGHNLRGLAVDSGGSALLVSHQMLNQRAGTTRENIERGVLMANVVRIAPLDGLLTAGANVEASGRLLHLGTPGAGAGDPAGLAVLDAKQVAVALAGVNEVALVGMDGNTAWRVGVGRRPTAVLSGQAGQPLVVINTFDDSLSLVDVRRGRVTRSIPLASRPELGPQERGELLFYDARLARDGWLSCHSCHTDGHTSGLLADTLGDNTYGTPKRTLTLLNTALTDPWAWNGQMKYLHDQVRQSLAETMHGSSASAEQVNDLVSFLHTLPPPPPVEPVTADEGDRRRVERGRRIFQERDCVHCHIPPLTYTSHETYDVGFADERGHRKFNPPSLRGVGQGYRFLHDNRAATLEEVFTKFRHKTGDRISSGDLADLLRFLRSL